MEGKSFKIITAISGKELVPLVNKEMEKGWIPTGMYSTYFNGNFNIYQGMMKPSTTEDPVNVDNIGGSKRRKTRRRV